MEIPFGATLAQLNAALFALQLLINFNQNAFTPADAARKPWMWTTLIQPQGIAFLIWLVIYVFTTATVGCDLFAPQLSLFTNAPALRVFFTVSCIVNSCWIVLFNWLRWVHIAALDLLAMWLSLLPIYLYSTQASDISWLKFVGSHLAIRLYFSWVSAAVMLNVSISWQTFRGDFLSFGPYAGMLAVLLTIVLSGIVYRHDNVVGGVAMWALFWLTKRTGEFEPAAQETLGKVQASAFVGLLVVGLTMVVAALHRQFSPQYVYSLPPRRMPHVSHTFPGMVGGLRSLQLISPRFRSATRH
jgi:hypothetical protein